MKKTPTSMEVTRGLFYFTKSKIEINDSSAMTFNVQEMNFACISRSITNHSNIIKNKYGRNAKNIPAWN